MVFTFGEVAGEAAGEGLQDDMEEDGVAVAPDGVSESCRGGQGECRPRGAVKNTL